MRVFLSAFLCVGLAGLASAEEQLPVVGPGPNAPAPPVIAEPDCPLPTKKVCVPEPALKKVTKTLYDVKCVDYCLPRCSPLCWFKQVCGECAPGDCAMCGKPRIRHVLVKRTLTEEQESFKCVVREVADEAPCKHGGFFKWPCFNPMGDLRWPGLQSILSQVDNRSSCSQRPSP